MPVSLLDVCRRATKLDARVAELTDHLQAASADVTRLTRQTERTASSLREAEALLAAADARHKESEGRSKESAQQLLQVWLAAVLPNQPNLKHLGLLQA
jgi:septal ring factor EnvC (AmiA/AmiB activator)